tara:strand:- start:389 stop:802 length:414 start_codon:yes stop_codon:yes gene_type:complete
MPLARLQDESDQAMVAYRTAAKLFSGCHLCSLFVGMECARTNNLPLAERYFEQAKDVCPNDPLVYNEMGVLHYRNEDYGRAREYFLRVLDLCGDRRRLETWETTLSNLGHTCRKLGKDCLDTCRAGQATHRLLARVR